MSRKMSAALWLLIAVASGALAYWTMEWRYWIISGAAFLLSATAVWLHQRRQRIENERFALWCKVAGLDARTATPKDLDRAMAALRSKAGSFAKD